MAVEGSITMSQVNAQLLNTKQFAYRDVMTRLVNSDISKGSIGMPTLDFFFDECQKAGSSYFTEMVDLYNGTFGLYEGVTEIPDLVKALQGAVIDSFCYFYNTETDKVGICTLNLQVLGLDPILDSKLTDKIFNANKLGHIHSLRVDFDYNNFNSEDMGYKVVAHKAVIDQEVTFLVPYLAGFCLSNTVQGYMTKGFMLATQQMYPNGLKKTRVITDNSKHLANYCDSASACEGLSTEYYPLQAFMYSPSLGSASTTAMKTRIDFFALEKIARVESYSQCQKFGIQKVADPVDELYKEQSIIVAMAKLRAQDPDSYARVVEKLPKDPSVEGIFNGSFAEGTLAVYLHSVTNGTVNKVLKLVPGAMAEYEKRKAIKSEGTNGEALDGSNLKKALYHNVIKLVWKKSNGLYASTVCTNSPTILKQIYGDNYFATYESKGVRVRDALTMVEFGQSDLTDSLVASGFDGSKAKEILDYAKANKCSTEDAAYEVLGVKTRAKGSNPDVVTARSLSGYLVSKTSEDGVVSTSAVDYYVSIDTAHLVRAEVVG